MSSDTKLILCPLNLRHAAMDFRAYEEAIAMAQRRNAKLLVATIAPEFERNLNMRDPEAYWSNELKKFVAAHPPGELEVETVVRKGAVHRQILKLANERNADIIVMESANPKVQDYLLGTTASHVVTHAKCSVYVVRR